MTDCTDKERNESFVRKAFFFTVSLRQSADNQKAKFCFLLEIPPSFHFVYFSICVSDFRRLKFFSLVYGMMLYFESSACYY